MNRLTLLAVALPLAVSACSSSNNGSSPDASTPRADAHHGSDTADAFVAPDGPEGIDAAVGSGFFAIPLSTPTGQDQGEFYTPSMTASGKSFLLDLDTGSTVTGIAGMCSTCGGLSPVYTPGANATATGGSDMAEYADGTGWSGSIYADTVGLGNGTPDVKLDFVDINAQSTSQQGGGFFFANEYQGILGMGPDALLDPGTTAYPDKVFAAGVEKVMAFELCPTDGTMWLGGFDATHAASAMQYTPILTTDDNAGFYSVDMTAIGLGTTDLGATATTLDGPIVDTGTSLFYIPSATETKLIKAINANTAFKTLFPGQTMTDPEGSGNAGCVNAAAGTTDAMVDAALPPLTETMGTGASAIKLSANALESYLYDAGGGQFCMAVFGGGDQGNATMGDTFMRGFVTVIDLVHNQVGFAPTSHCESPAIARERLAVQRPQGPLRELGRGPHHVRRAH